MKKEEQVGWAKGLYPVPIKIQANKRWARYRFAHPTDLYFMESIL